MRKVQAIILVAAALFTGPALGEEVRVISGSRILLRDVVPGTSEELGRLDLGPTPTPGGSRLFTIEDVRSRLRRANADTTAMDFREPIRIVAAHRTIQPEELAKLAAPSIQAALPSGVLLLKVTPTVSVTTRLGATVGRATIPALPRRAGEARSTAVVELVDGADVLTRIPIPVTLELSPKAAAPDVVRGASIRVFVENGAVVVSTRGEVLTDASIGELVRVSLTSTHRVVRARLISLTQARVLAP